MFTEESNMAHDVIEDEVIKEGDQPRVTGDLEEDHIRSLQAQRKSELTTYQKRVVEEKLDLDVRLFRLSSFLPTELFYETSEAEQMRLQRQEMLMRLYSQVLGERIAAFKGVDRYTAGQERGAEAMTEDEIDDIGDIAAHLLVHAEECSGDARLLGNVRAQDLAKLCHWVLMILDEIEQESEDNGPRGSRVSSKEDQERMREVFRVCDGVPTIVLQGMEAGGVAWLLHNGNKQKGNS
jgi:hypothetical protein